MASLDLFSLCIVGLASFGYALKVQTEQGQHSPQVDPSLDGKLPIEWVHVQKAGTSFLNTLMHIPGVCPGLPTDLIYNSTELEMEGSPGNSLQYTFWKQYDLPSNCNPSAWDVDYRRISHFGIECRPNGGFAAGKGRFMIFMRQPEQRLLSAYNYQPMGQVNDIESVKLTHSGAATRLLTEPDRCSDESELEPITSAEVQEAKIRLQTGFSFIGITDHWDLSICLFNAMFNQACRSLQFLNGHPTAGSTSSTYDTALLNGWRDPYDNELYDVAMERFHSDLKRYNVSEASCEPCWREAGLL